MYSNAKFKEQYRIQMSVSYWGRQFLKKKKNFFCLLLSILSNNLASWLIIICLFLFDIKNQDLRKDSLNSQLVSPCISFTSHCQQVVSSSIIRNSTWTRGWDAFLTCKPCTDFVEMFPFPHSFFSCAGHKSCCKLVFQ